jgi:glycosyltransferase involved in cell wall biosynthesis
MSRILLLSYYFPPIGGAGAQRPAKFARFLHDLGHDVVVLTGSGRTGMTWTPADPTLERAVPPGVEVVRVPGPEPAPSEGMRNRFERLTRRDNDWVRWWQAGVLRAGAALQGIDVIHTIMSPFSSAEASDRLARRLGIGWIADLGDPWALDEMMVYPTALHRRLELRRMRRLLGTAAAIVMSTPEAARQLVDEFPELGRRRVTAIPNGFDAADFDGATAPVASPSKTFRIVHTGYLHTAAGLRQRDQSFVRRLVGGGRPGVDILTRSHYFLLEAIERLLQRDPTLRERLELHLAGVISAVDSELAERSGIAVLHGYMSHAESIALMRTADLLFLPMQELPAGQRSTTVPGKTYEYLASGRRILAAVPPGDARDLIAASGRGIVCEPSDVDGLARAITDAMSTRTESIRNDEFARRYSYEALAGEVASVVADVVEESSTGSNHATRHHG